MEKISWTNEWSVDHDKIDQQHKNILKIINRLIELYGFEKKPEVFISILNDFQVCANEHLHYEEYILSINNFHDLDNHKKVHRYYLENFYSQLSIVRKNCSSESIYEMILLLKDWWSHHICNEDSKYRNLFK